MGKLDQLHMELVRTMKVTRGTQASFTLSFSWKEGLIDLPEACNRLSRHYKVPNLVTIFRRTSPTTEKPEGGHQTTLRFSNITPKQCDAIYDDVSGDTAAVARIILKSRG